MAGHGPAPATFPAPPQRLCRLSSPVLSRAPCHLIIFMLDSTEMAPACKFNPDKVTTRNTACILIPEFKHPGHHFLTSCGVLFNMAGNFSACYSYLGVCDCAPPQAGLITLNRLREWPINPVASHELDFSVGLCLCLSVCISSLLALRHLFVFHMFSYFSSLISLISFFPPLPNCSATLLGFPFASFHFIHSLTFVCT